MGTPLWWQRAVLARELLQYLGRPLTLGDARAALRGRVERRSERFLDIAGRQLLFRPGAVYQELLSHAGWTLRDLEAGVRRDGLEPTLVRLRDAGVRVTPAEFKGREPIVRPGLRLETSAGSFDNPILPGGRLQAATSGSRSASTRVQKDWASMEEEAANECALLEAHGLLDRPGAFWMPGPPSISGIHNLLLHLKFAAPPVRWFSQLRGSAMSRAMMTLVTVAARAAGLATPWPEFAEAGDAPRIAAWMSEARRRGGRCYLKAFASAAVRVAGAARSSRMDLSGCVFFTGGEPLTAARHRVIESTGARAFARYVATESGLVAGGCPACAPPDTMHLYTDRLAVIPGTDDRLLFTGLSPSCGKLLLNVDLGDTGSLASGECDCALGRAGMNVFLSGVGSDERLTGEGMSLPGSRLVEIVEQIVVRAGGGPDDFQIRVRSDPRGLVALEVVVDPAVPNLDPEGLSAAVLDALKRNGTGEGIVAEFWKQAGTLKLARGKPELSAGGKLLRMVRVDS